MPEVHLDPVSGVEAAAGRRSARPADPWRLLTGRVLQHALLLAAASGVQAGYCHQPCQVAALRPRVREALRLAGQPQVILRLGVPHARPRAVPRRPVDDVLMTR